MAETHDSLCVSAAALGVALTSVKAQNLRAYVRGILSANLVTNVTAVRDEAEAESRLLLDALALGLHLQELPLPAGSVVADLGSGGGFPGAVLGLVWPEWQVHLVESRGRKLAAVQQALRGLDAANIQLAHTRMEQIAAGALKRRCDLVTCRAVGPLRTVLALSAPALKQGGALIAWKSAELPAGEMDEAAGTATQLGFTALSAIPYTSYKPSQLVRFRKHT